MKTFNNKECGEGKKMNTRSRLPVTIVLILVFSVFFTAEITVAQTSQYRILSLEETLSIALNKSYSIQTQKLGLQRSQNSLEAQLRGLRTRADLTWTAFNRNKGIEPSFLSSGVEYYSDDRISTNAILSLTQPVLPLNGTFELMANYTTIDQYLEEIDKTNQFWTDDLRLEYRQPILQPNTQKIELKQLERTLEITEGRFEETQNMIYYRVIQMYYDLVQAKKQLEINQESVQYRQETYNNTMNKYRAGIMAEVDALGTEVDLDEAKITAKGSELEYIRQLDEFKRYIGLPLTENIDVGSEVTIDIIDIDEEKAINEALERDAGLRNQRLEILNTKDNIETTKALRKFKAQLTFSYGLSESEILDEHFKDNLFKDFGKSNSVDLKFTIPIFDWGQQKLRVENAQVDLKRSELDLDNDELILRRSIQDIINNINNAKDKMEIQAKSEEVAQKRYDINVERYNIGEITNETLYLSSQALTNTKSSVLSARIQYLKAVAELNQRTYWDFINNCPLSETLSQYIVVEER